MANMCEFTMQVMGIKSDIRELVRWFNAKYSVREGVCSEKHHFYRTTCTTEEDFNNETANHREDECMIAILTGRCANSVYVCMFDGANTYFELNKENDDYATTLLRASEELNLRIEVVGTAPEGNFKEHYVMRKGVLEVEECKEFEQPYSEREILRAHKYMSI